MHLVTGDISGSQHRKKFIDHLLVSFVTEGFRHHLCCTAPVAVDYKLFGSVGRINYDRNMGETLISFQVFKHLFAGHLRHILVNKEDLLPVQWYLVCLPGLIRFLLMVAPQILRGAQKNEKETTVIYIIVSQKQLLPGHFLIFGQRAKL